MPCVPPGHFMKQESVIRVSKNSFESLDSTIGFKSDRLFLSFNNCVEVRKIWC